jgi:hypothetical protein
VRLPHRPASGCALAGPLLQSPDGRSAHGGRALSTTIRGGHPAVAGPVKGDFIVTREKLGIGRQRREVKWLAACPVESIERIQVGGGQVGKSKAGAVLAFGVLGLAAKGSKDRTDILVHLKDGYLAYFTIDAPVPMTKAYLVPTLQQLQVPVEFD